MDSSIMRQLRLLQASVAILFVIVIFLGVNLEYPLIPVRFNTVQAGQIQIRERDGTLKAVLSNSEGFSRIGDSRANQKVPFSGLMLYNQEGDEEGGLVYSGKAIPGGQHADVTLTFDQYRQDQNIYLHHEEHKDANGQAIDDGLTIISRPDRALVKQEYAIYAQMDKLAPDARDQLKLTSLQEGKISTKRLFVGDRRGIEKGKPYDDAGVFIKNRWGRDAIKLYVDADNRPHLDVYDKLGTRVTYSLIPEPSH
jgi:hypothetical protein